eukprot:gnl/TRDRNA2_/TRDRNA2_189359_c0_seq1.p1 gnl/TRDRNA2_/TRDRNA2_189359_c0~~gnl/TRDRNA2_/TRDRNA2_189359_c0_seq1.p1  ORF type:complete len:620 (-),score=53.14 gnl/TRDRNA2_/TRDRNA2_189359_c0_seq1:107-1966(-)
MTNVFKIIVALITCAVAISPRDAVRSQFQEARSPSPHNHQLFADEAEPKVLHSAALRGSPPPHTHLLFVAKAEPTVKWAPQSNLDKYPVSATLRCIINIAVQTMIVYLMLACARTYHEVTGTVKGTLEAALTAAHRTMPLGPMLCVLFIACRQRVVWLSQGQGHPQLWVQYCMYGSAYAVIANTLMVLAIALTLGREPKVNDDGDVSFRAGDMHELRDHRIVLRSLQAVRYVILLALYVGVTGVIIGMCIYKPPAGTWPGDSIPPPQPAALCVMIMTIAFFGLYFFVVCCRTSTQLSGGDVEEVEEVMLAATRTMEFAPMLCILFLASRMRALEMDPVYGNPQDWAHVCFYLCTGAILLQTCLAIAVPMLQSSLRTSPRWRATDGTTSVEIDSGGSCRFYVEGMPILTAILKVCEYLILLCIYGGFTAVIVSIFLIEHPKGPEYTRPIAPAVQCVIILVIQFFLVYLMIWIIIRIQDFNGRPLSGMRFFTALEKARNTVMMAPMLCILFVATRMRALELTDNKGAPQPWAQHSMYLSTGAMLITLFVSLLSHLSLRHEVDEHGNVFKKYDSPWIAIPILTIRYLAVLLMFVGIVIVVVSVFLITPETATGRGSGRRRDP